MDQRIELEWCSVERESLLSVLAGNQLPTQRVYASPDIADGSDVIVGVSRGPEYRAESFLGVALLPDDPREILSWISTYAEEAFPLSQYCRVLTRREWSDLGSRATEPRVLAAVSHLWPSMVVGEMLGQVGLDAGGSSVPISRASACLSFAFARTALLYPDLQFAANACMERLSRVEREPRFGRRHLTTVALKKVWAAATALGQVPQTGGEVADLVMQTAAGLNSDVMLALQDADGLLGDSAEGRVVAFDRVVDALSRLSLTEASSRNMRALTLACAALLAGRGTSHVGLLAGHSRDLPEALVYFGLLAGVVGPRCWDKNWTQQAKGVERMLRQFYRIDEPVQADICWSEFEWLAGTYSAPEVLGRLPRSNASGLAIELLPGVVCQFRLADHSTGSRPGGAARSGDSAGAETDGVLGQEAMEQAKRLVHQLQELLDPASVASARQGSLFEREQRERSTRSRSKSGKRSG
jgi:hypothetical protein